MKHISLRVIFQNGMCPVVPICMAVRTTLKLSIFILYPILLLYFYFCLFSFIQSQKLNKIIFSSLFNIFIVFHNSGFKGTLCGGKWLSLTGSKNAFNNLGTGYAQHPGSTARYGCCPANKYMSSPEGTGTFVEADSCSACPVGRVSIPNDDTSDICKNICPSTQVINSNKATSDSITGIIDATVTVTCNPGWSGSGTTTCGSNLQWSTVPTCTVNSCAATQVANSNKAVSNSITGAHCQSQVFLR